MKKLISFIITICACLTVNGQTIKYDEYLNDSTKYYSTSPVICRSFTDKMVLSVALTKNTFRSGRNYYVMDLTINTGEASYTTKWKASHKDG